MMKVVEIFHSYQGEGPFIGTPCTFVRLYGCNMKCSFCDTNFETYVEKNIDEIVEEVEDDIVVITGGEPTINEDLNVLIESLLDEGKEVHIETNGFNEYYNKDIKIVVSPKKEKERIFRFYSKYDNCFLKFVIENEEDIIQLKDMVQNTNYRKMVWVQPEFSKDDLIIDDILNSELKNYRISIQTHKYVNKR